MAESKLECSGSYTLPQGPRGEDGPIGEYGATPVSAPVGPAGDTGLPGRSKIDIIFQGENGSYKELNGTNNLYSPGNNFSFLGSFLYPGNIAFGGDPREFLLLMETSGVTIKNYNFIVFTNMTEYPTGTSVDTQVANTKVAQTSSIVSRKTDNGNLRVVSLQSNIDRLPDTESLIGIYIKNPEEVTTNMKFYSAELY